MSLLIGTDECRSLHFTGVLGAGMSALAQFTCWLGLKVSGSDRALGAEDSTNISQYLTSLGCSLFPQDGSGLDEKPDALVVSSAIEESNPEILRARQLKIPVFHRSDVLAAIIKTKKAIAVAGTSGKSTVTAMIFHLLQACGKNPSLITGAGLKSLQKRGMPGNALYQEGEWMVVEADESDGSLVKYQPYMTLLLNVSKDHKTVEETIGLFSTLAGQSEIVVKSSDEHFFENINATYEYGQSFDANYSAQLWASGRSSGFLHEDDNYRTPLPGMHNASNLFASFVCALLCGCSKVCLKNAAEQFEGLDRRFSIIEAGGVTVVDDYAHNPEKIRAAVSAAQSISERAFVLFQPHGFGPMKFMRRELAEMFRKTLRSQDTLYILPIYYAGGSVQRDISSADLAADLAGSGFAVHAPCDREQPVQEIVALVRNGDLILNMGARDPSLSAFAQSIADRLNDLPLRQ